MAVRAEEQLRDIETAAFGSAPTTEPDVRWRTALLDRLQRLVHGRPGDDDRDDYGRRVLIGYDAVRQWMDHWQAQDH